MSNLTRRKFVSGLALSVAGGVLGQCAERRPHDGPTKNGNDNNNNKNVEEDITDEYFKENSIDTIRGDLQDKLKIKFAGMLGVVPEEIEIVVYEDNGAVIRGILVDGGESESLFYGAKGENESEDGAMATFRKFVSQSGANTTALLPNEISYILKASTISDANSIGDINKFKECIREAYNFLNNYEWNVGYNGTINTSYIKDYGDYAR